MTKIQNEQKIQGTKIDFSLIIEVKKANANGDPINGNLPRQNLEGNGEISDVAIKRKIRNRWMQEGEAVYLQSADNTTDGFYNLKDRIKGTPGIKQLIEKTGKKGKLTEDVSDDAIAILKDAYLDIRAFGAVITLKDEFSRGIRGAVSITQAESINPVVITTQKIVKSVSLDAAKGSKGSDTMGEKHRVEYGVYRLNGSINAYLAEKNELTTEDVEKIKRALITLFENDESSARPTGSMNVINLYWWEHSSKTGDAPSHKVYETLKITSDTDEPTSLENYKMEVVPTNGVPVVKVIEGF